jgi:plasmid stabilization system protein ParE
MAAQKRRPVVRANRAQFELADIWRWNADRYGEPHADAYLAFLDRSIEELSVRFASGRPVANRPDLRFILMQQRSKAHGHVAVYRIEPDTIQLLHVFHTAQDWEAKL